MSHIFKVPHSINSTPNLSDFTCYDSLFIVKIIKRSQRLGHGNAEQSTVQLHLAHTTALKKRTIQFLHIILKRLVWFNVASYFQVLVHCGHW